MIILDTKQFYQDPRMTLNLFRKLLYNNYYILKENNSEVNLIITRMFSEEDIDKAFKAIYLDKHRNIYIDSHIRGDLILRYLEYRRRRNESSSFNK